jgi:hypothetical protein
MTKHLIDCSALLRDFPEDTRTSVNIHVSRYSCKTDGGIPCLSWGQKAKYSLRADVVRSAPNNRLDADISPQAIIPPGGA